MFFHRSVFFRYGSAAVLVFLAWMIRQAFDPILGDRIPFMSFFPAVAAAAYYCGFGPAIFATVSSMLVTDWFFVTPRHAFAIPGLPEFLAEMMFLTASAGFVLFSRRIAAQQLRLLAEVRKQGDVERALRQAKEFNEKLLASSEDCIKVIDLEGRMLHFSVGGLKAMEITDPASVLHKAYGDFWKGADQVAALRALETARSGGTGKFEGFCPTQSGKPKWWSVVVTPIYDDQARVEKLLAISRDVTERKEADEKIVFQAGLLNAVGDAVIATDLCGKVLSWNREAERLYGWTENEALGKNILSLTPAETSRDQAREIMSALQQGKSWSGEFAVRRADGTDFIAMVTDTPITNEEGELVGIVGVSRDVSIRRRDEQILRDSQEKFSKIFLASPEAMVLSHPDGRVLDINESWQKLLGYGREEIIGRTVEHLSLYVNPADRVRFRQLLKDTGRLPDSEVQLRIRSGDVRSVVLSVESLVIKGETLYLTILRDVTEQKHFEQLIQKGRQQLETVIDNIGAYIAYCDCEHRFKFVNLPYAQRFNLSREAIINRTIPEVLGKTVFALIKPYIERALAGEAVEFELPVAYENLGTRYVKCSYVPEFDSDRKVIGYVALITDLTERRLQEETLRENEARLRTALDAGKLGTWEWDIQHNKVFWSDRIYQFHGLQQHEFDGTIEAFGKLVHADDASMVSQMIQSALENKAPYEFEFRVVRPDGKVRWLYTSARVIFDQDRTPLRMLGGTIDLTDRKLIEIELRAAQEGLALHTGQLEKQVAERTATLQETTQQLEAFCYTVAHDLRAPLRAQQAFGFALLEEYGLLLDDTAKDYLNRIINSASHLNQLVNDLLAYARLSREELQFEPIDLNELLTQILSDNANQIRNHQARITRQKSFPRVRGHEITLKLSVENLLSNAMKFMPAGVKPEIHFSAERRDQRVRICIQDNGIGIEPEHQTQIFGVFHRLHTKAYPGTGIGLALVDKAIQRMGGRVGVESTPGQGSRFWFELPVFEEK